MSFNDKAKNTKLHATIKKYSYLVNTTPEKAFFKIIDIKIIPLNEKNSNTCFECECICGNKFFIPVSKNQKYNSCGCKHYSLKKQTMNILFYPD